MCMRLLTPFQRLDRQTRRAACSPAPPCLDCDGAQAKGGDDADGPDRPLRRESAAPGPRADPRRASHARTHEALRPRRRPRPRHHRHGRDAGAAQRLEPAFLRRDRAPGPARVRAPARCLRRDRRHPARAQRGADRLQPAVPGEAARARDQGSDRELDDAQARGAHQPRGRDRRQPRPAHPGGRAEPDRDHHRPRHRPRAILGAARELHRRALVPVGGRGHSGRRP